MKARDVVNAVHVWAVANPVTWKVLAALAVGLVVGAWAF